MAKLTKNIKIRDRLFTRLLLSHILIVSLPLFLTGKVLVDTAQDSIQKTILKRNQEFAKRSTRLIELKINMAEQLIKSQVKNQSVYEMKKRELELAINTLLNEFDLFNRISVIDTNKTVVATTSFEENPQLRIFSQGRENLAFSILRAGQSYRSDVYMTDEHLPMLDEAEPIFYHNEIVGFLYAEVDLKAMWDIVQENVVGKLGEAFIFNKNGQFIAHSQRKNVYLKRSFQNEDILRDVRAGHNGQLIYTNEKGIKMVAAYAPIGNFGWGAMIQQPSSEAFASAQRMRIRVLQIMFVSIMLASLLAYFYTRAIVKPVNALVSGMGRFSKGELSHRIEKISQDEIGTLAEHFNDMADRLIEFQNTLKRTEVLETMRKLSSVLSHEIRNPLNAMVINMQILKRELSKEKVDKERVQNFYDILSSEIKRVDQLVSDFLLIARPSKIKPAKVALNDILDKIVTLQIGESLRKGVRIERDYADTPVYANVDAGKMRQVFLNLSINAIQAMPGGGKLRVGLKNISLSNRSHDKERWVEIVFADSGHGISKMELDKIFDFYFTTKEEGSGLGLAVVQQIIDEHRGKITVESKIDTGTKFTILIPAE